MSFSSDIKNELAEIKLSDCCKAALTYGFLLFSRAFSVKRICMQTENERTARLYVQLLKEVYGADVRIVRGGSKRITFRASVISETDRLRILASIDFGIHKGKINREQLTRECCQASFIRGAFLACGQLSDPQICYRADFPVRNIELAREFSDMLSNHFITANVANRGNSYVVYIKRSEMVINLLTVMGASARSLEMIETTIIKELKNDTNRIRNCDSGNISRTVEASIKQRKAIEYLKKTGRLETLPEELISAAALRTDNPESSLRQLALQSREPITASGLNHRLGRLIEIYEECKKRGL